jgi:hypothetical protein
VLAASEVLRIEGEFTPLLDRIGIGQRVTKPDTSHHENKATGEGSSISGGGGGEASGVVSSVTGGRLGKTPYFASTVLGGLEEVTEAEYGVTP